MRVSRLVAAGNWRYAIGEIVLIVVGVTLALAATSWYEERQERRDEIVILQQLRQTLEDDLREVDFTWRITRQRVQNISALLDHIEAGKPYSPELGANFQALLGWRIVTIKTAPFEALKTQGYATISNPALRGKLISFYEDSFGSLNHNLNLDRDLAIDKVQPYFFDNFVIRTGGSTDVDGGKQEWVPRDYEQIVADGYVASIGRFRVDILERFVLRQYETTAAAMREIIDEIDRELASTE